MPRLIEEKTLSSRTPRVSCATRATRANRSTRTTRKLGATSATTFTHSRLRYSPFCGASANSSANSSAKMIQIVNSEALEQRAQSLHELHDQQERPHHAEHEHRAVEPSIELLQNAVPLAIQGCFRSASRP